MGIESHQKEGACGRLPCLRAGGEQEFLAKEPRIAVLPAMFYIRKTTAIVMQFSGMGSVESIPEYRLFVELRSRC